MSSFLEDKLDIWRISGRKVVDLKDKAILTYLLGTR